ncbi:UNVERIFIED_CONTAM: NADH-ubiquinone oxidoreductase chain 2 [Sesamum calycinum]|uniref:NADH-ubiquinone oxidoreductase chain 2 n=1 Tax=Sesamum calycinum TaxID=2727403 RepID=A0AAW2JI39_9LAMI
MKKKRYLAAFAPSKTALVPFLSPFRLLLCFVPIESKAKWFVCLLYLLDERERTFFPFRVYGLDRFCQRNERGARSECFSDPEVLAKRIRCCSPSSVFSRFANLPRGRGRKKPKRLREDAQLLGPFFQCNTGKRPFCHPLAYWDSTGFACPLQDSGSARESAGNNRKEGVHVAAAPAPFLVNGAQQVRHLLQKRESTSDNHASARQRVEWPRADLFGYIIQVESRVTGTAV